MGKYNEFDQLRIAGVRHADLKGFAFSRADVNARSLANAYAQSLGQVFTHDLKPMEVEILVAEVGLAADGSGDRLFHILYDGTLVDEDVWVVLGGETDAISERFSSSVSEEKGQLSLAVGTRAAVAALAGSERRLQPRNLEAAVLERGDSRRSFRRLVDADLESILKGSILEGS